MTANKRCEWAESHPLLVSYHGQEARGALRGARTLHNRHRRMADIPVRTPLSDAVSKDLEERGFCPRHRVIVRGG